LIGGLVGADWNKDSFFGWQEVHTKRIDILVLIGISKHNILSIEQLFAKSLTATLKLSVNFKYQICIIKLIDLVFSEGKLAPTLN
jgi:hypothetical protein